MLRMWRKRDGKGKSVWCASLEEPGSHHTETFTSLRTLYSFLDSRLGIEQQGIAQQEQPEQQADLEQPR